MHRKVTAEELLEMVASGARVVKQQNDPVLGQELRELTQRLGELLARNPNIIVESKPLDVKIDAPPVHVDVAAPSIKVPPPTVIVREAKTRDYEFHIERNHRGQIERVFAHCVDGETVDGE